MEKKIFIFILILLITLSCLFLSCDNPLDSKKRETYVSKIDMEEIAKRHLADFELKRKRAMWDRGRRFVYQNDNAQVDVSVQVGLYPSTKDAEDVIFDYQKYLSIAMIEDSSEGESIGNRFWWAGSEQNNITHIMFLRNNALFIMSCSHNYGKLKDLATKIDNDIINEESYISIENSISLPKINSITVGKSNFKEGESTKITVNAIDPGNEALEYIFQGLFHNDYDPENVFTFTASRDYVGEPFFGSHTIEFYVINESNVLSRSAEITIKILK